MIQGSLRLKIIAFFVLLLIVDWFLYFRHAGHFFQGDTVFLINHHAASFSGYWKEFTSLSLSGWFRPLANEVLNRFCIPSRAFIRSLIAFLSTWFLSASPLGSMPWR